MNIIVDTNIVFSALLKPSSKFFNILHTNDKNQLKFYTSTVLIVEIEENKSKLLNLTGYDENGFELISKLILDQIIFIDLKKIPLIYYLKAESLLRDIDIDDTEFIALTDYLHGRLWTGDKKLIKKLKAKNWDKFITSEFLLDFINYNNN